MDLDTVVRIHRLHKFIITWRGSSEVKQFCEQKLLLFFNGNTITWERSGRQIPSPLHIKLQMQFVPFGLDTVNSPYTFELEKTAILHFFFMEPATVDEYRNGYRNDVIEWCTTLNRVDDVQWMVVFSSTKARERRNRGAVMEKIKGDFAKSMNRVIEIDENAADSLDSLYLTSKVYMLSFLDKTIIAEEKRLSDRKEDYYRLDFDYVAYSNAQMRLIQLYHSLNVLERVLAKLDELDGLLSLIVGYFIEQSVRPKWVSNGANAESECCPLLSVMSCQKQLKHNFLLDARTFIAAQKIVALLLLYKERLVPDKNSSCLLQIKSDFAAIVLRHAYHCITATFENIAALLLSVDNNRLQCWTASFCLESLQIVRLVVGNTLPRSLSHFVCSLCVLKYKAIKHLIISKEKLSDMLSWFDSAIQASNMGKLSDAVLRFRNCFAANDAVHELINECFESSSTLLEQYGWIRQLNVLNYEHASLLLVLNQPKLAVPYLIKVACLLIRDGSPLLPDLLPIMIRKIEDNSETFIEELLNFYMVLTLCGRTSEERVHYCQKLVNNLKTLAEHSQKQMYYPKTWKRYMPLYISYLGSVHQHVKVGTPGQSLSILLSIANEFPISLPDCKICCIYKKVPNVEAFGKMEINSHYKCTYSAVEQIARFGCVIHRNNEVDAEAESNENENIIFEPKANCFCNLSSGTTVLELTAESSRLCCGVFVLDHVDVTILSTLVLSFAWADFQIDKCIQRPIYFIYKQMPAVYLETPTDKLYAGVWQKLQFELNFGSEADSETESALKFQTPRYEDSIKFWCPTVSNWSSKGIFRVKKNSTGLPVIISVYVYCSMNRLMKYCSEEDAALFTKQLSVTWQGLQWNFSVTFIPLIKAKTTVSLLEEKLLLELQFVRGNDNAWILIPESTTLISNTDNAEIPAKLLNYKLTEILPRSSYRIVWLLDGEDTLKNAVEEFRLKFKYRIQSKKQTADEMEAFCNQIYEYQDVLVIPNIKASYELFAQILPAQPGAVLCRVNIPCDLIVSLRSLSNRVETVIISIDADETYWSTNEKHKFLYVKESGLGQTSFAVVPNITGFLPYPSITVHRCQHKRSNSDKSTQSRCDETDFGAVVPSFVRSGGKQVHVLGLQHSGTGDQKYGNERSKRLKEAKNRLAKFFD